MTQTTVQKYAETLTTALEIPDEYLFGFARGFYSFVSPVIAPLEQLVKETFPTGYDYASDYVKDNLLARYLADHPGQEMKPEDVFPFFDPADVLITIVGFFVGLFVFFVIGKILGKHKYRPLIVVHNSVLFWLSLYMALGINGGRLELGYSYINNAPSMKHGGARRLCKIMWICYVSKILEFVDTFIMMLTQSYRQVTFLHVYHHISVFFLAWFTGTASPNGDTTLPVSINCFVHVVMYAYYTATAAFPDPKNPIRRFLNSIKFVITKGQIVQFGVVLVEGTVLMFGLVEPKVPKPVYYTNFYYSISLMVLFLNFLIVNQARTAVAKKADKKKVE